MLQACNGRTASVNASVVYEVQSVSSTGIVIEAALLAILTFAVAFGLTNKVSSMPVYYTLKYGCSLLRGIA